MKRVIFVIAFILVLLRVVAANLKSETIHIIDTIHSKYLNEDRLVSVYLPPNYDKHKIYPVIFATDGQIIDNLYREALDSVINGGKLSGVIIIAAFSNEKQIDKENYTYRQAEYIKGWADNVYENIFYNYLNFFAIELIKYAEQTYKISVDKSSRYFYGCSNGAGFGVTLSVEKPELISNYICFSMAGGKYSNLKQGVNNYPYIYLFYGDKEPPPLTMQIDEYDKYLLDKGYDHKLTVYKGGHDREIWRKLFIEHLIAVMGN